MIRIYPSRLPGEPLETHQHKAMTLHQWFVDNVDGYQNVMRHPVSVEVNGKGIPLKSGHCVISALKRMCAYFQFRMGLA